MLREEGHTPPKNGKAFVLVDEIQYLKNPSEFLKLIADHQPTHIAASFDLAGPTFRDAIVDDYKANRAEMPADLAEQIAWVHDYSKARVLGYQSGHDARAWTNKSFRRLMAQGIRWVAGRLAAD